MSFSRVNTKERYMRGEVNGGGGGSGENYTSFIGFWRVRNAAKSDYYCCHVCRERLGSN